MTSLQLIAINKWSGQIEINGRSGKEWIEITIGLNHCFPFRSRSFIQIRLIERRLCGSPINATENRLFCTSAEHCTAERAAVGRQKPTQIKHFTLPHTPNRRKTSKQFEKRPKNKRFQFDDCESFCALLFLLALVSSPRSSSRFSCGFHRLQLRVTLTCDERSSTELNEYLRVVCSLSAVAKHPRIRLRRRCGALARSALTIPRPGVRRSGALLRLHGVGLAAAGRRALRREREGAQVLVPYLSASSA